MKRFLAAIARRLAPRTLDGLADIADVRAVHGSVGTSLDLVFAAIDRQKAEIDGLKAEIDRLMTEIERLTGEVDEMRKDGRYVAELYDLVFTRLRASQPSEGIAPEAPRQG